MAAEEQDGPDINFFAIIGAKQVQIEMLQNNLKILAEGFQQLQLENAELKAKYEPEENAAPENNGHKETVPDLTLVDTPPVER